MVSRRILRPASLLLACAAASATARVLSGSSSAANSYEDSCDHLLLHGTFADQTGRDGFLDCLREKGLYSEQEDQYVEEDEEEEEDAAWPLDFGYSRLQARTNALFIFNAVQDAMRQFGSSLHHNGMSVIPAFMPEGTLLYHGTHTTDIPKSFEWLAFEIQHAENFARTWKKNHWPKPPGKGGKGPNNGDDDDDDDDKKQKRGTTTKDADAAEWGLPLHGRVGLVSDSLSEDAHASTSVKRRSDDNNDDDDDDDDDEEELGYLHTYRATRPLHLLYLDGTAAGKTDMGTLDTQDLLLTGPHRDRGGFDGHGNGSRAAMSEFERARDLCALTGHPERWPVDGFIRMEPGFEIIYCDFASGLELVSARQRSGFGDPANVVGLPGFGGGPKNDTQLMESFVMATFQWVRAAAERYQDIGSGRVVPDFNAMVSAFWFPGDMFLSSEGEPESEEPLPRLTGFSDSELAIMKRYVRIATRRSYVEGGGINGVINNWQGVTDMIVARYADALRHMAATPHLARLKIEVVDLLDVHMDYADPVGLREDKARKDCVAHHLSPIKVRTAEDGMLYAAVEGTLERICDTLLEVRGLVIKEKKDDDNEDDDEDDDVTLFTAQTIIRGLIKALDWARWKDCGHCPGADEVCFVAMWPFGDTEDHKQPSCLSVDDNVGKRGGYWFRQPKGGEKQQRVDVPPSEL